MEAIILAGGFGSRLRPVVSDVPKPMAPVAGRPFLARLIEHLGRRGFKRVILAVGYMHSLIVDYFRTHPAPLELHFSIESEPMGTGGAVKLAMGSASADNVFVLNGDTFALLNYGAMLQEHVQHGAMATLALTLVPDSARFGSVRLDMAGRILAFDEKGRAGPGVVNAGTYVLNRRWVSDQWPNGAFSLEHDMLLKEAGHVPIYGFNANGELLDIGTPQSYADAARFVNLMST